MRLHTGGTAEAFSRPIVARVTTTPVPQGMRRDAVLVVASAAEIPEDVEGYAAVVSQSALGDRRISIPTVHSVREIDHLQPGYVIVLEPMNGFIRTLYRPESLHNTIFVTERCNSNCLMCSQPPIDTDDVDPLTERNLKLIDLIDPAPEYLCITGGEPTLTGHRLLSLVEQLRDKMPQTWVHMLTNGRRFAWQPFTSEFAAVSHQRLSLGIPLYSDDASVHDHVVQAKGAFDQTILGLHQLARHEITVEIRVVLHALTIPRLTKLAEYICRNLTFTDHVALMGMEPIGYAPRNMGELWIDPIDYQRELQQTVEVLTRFGIETRIYNLQLCVLPRSLWKYAKQSISDWKNIYSGVCKDCAVRSRCGGFFHWNTKVQSRGIRPIDEEQPFVEIGFPSAQP
jgi:His-Xaa-Ser system radical SAM maturase HxsC